MSVPSTAYAVPRPTKYCQACGSVIDAAAVVCPACGVVQADMAGVGGYPVPYLAGRSEKRVLVAVLLCFFLGVFGVHRFYAGKTGTGVLQLVTLGGFGLWALVDLVLLATGNFRDGDGDKITQWT